jgi:hypothetical protein
MSKSKTPYEVGYGKPPESAQFRAGVSGNPKGRPKGARSISSILAKMGRERVRITAHGRVRSVTKLEAVFMQLINKAAGGDIKATREFLAANRLFPEPTEVIDAPTAPSERGAALMQSILTRIRNSEAAVEPRSNHPPEKKEDE